MTVQYFSREAWDNSGAPRLGYVVPVSQFTGLAVHHTVTTPPQPGNVQAAFAHMRYLRTLRPDLGLDVPYSFVVFRGFTDLDAIVCEGRGAGRTGAHTYGFNSTRYGVAVVGNFDVEMSTSGIREAIRYVGRMFCNWATSPTMGHQQFPDPPLDHTQTDCCGSNLLPQMGVLQPPFASIIPTPVPPKPKPTGANDMAMPQVVVEDGTVYILDVHARGADGRGTAIPIGNPYVLADLVAYGVVLPPGDDSPGRTYHGMQASIAARFNIAPVWR